MQRILKLTDLHIPVPDAARDLGIARNQKTPRGKTSEGKGKSVGTENRKAVKLHTTGIWPSIAQRSGAVWPAAHGSETLAKHNSCVVGCGWSDGLCPRCLAEGFETEETMLHRVWQSPCNPTTGIQCNGKMVQERGAAKHGRLWKEMKPLLLASPTGLAVSYINTATVYEVKVGAQYLLTSIAKPARTKRGTNGDLWRATESDNVSFGSHALGGATLQRRSWTSVTPRGSTCVTTRSQTAGRAATRVEVLPSQANAVQAIDGMNWQVRMRIIEANLVAISGQPNREFLPPHTAAQRKTMQQKRASMEHAINRRWTKREIYRCARCGRAGSLQNWNLEPTTCTAILARYDDRRVETPSLRVPTADAERCSDHEDPFGHGGAHDAEEECGASTQRRMFEHESPEEHHVNKLILGNGVVERPSLSAGSAAHEARQHRDC